MKATERQKERAREYYAKNRERMLILSRLNYHANKARRRETHKIWAENNKSRISLRNKEYREKNREKLNEYIRKWRIENCAYLKQKKFSLLQYHEKYKNDVGYRLKRRARAHVSRIKTGHLKCPNKSMEYIGCTVEQFRKHIESLWLDGMHWGNNTTRGWHIDHIRPLSSFDLTDPNQAKAALHYTNLQPLWAIDNLKKYTKII